MDGGKGASDQQIKDLVKSKFSSIKRSLTQFKYKEKAYTVAV